MINTFHVFIAFFLCADSILLYLQSICFVSEFCKVSFSHVSRALRFRVCSINWSFSGRQNLRPTGSELFSSKPMWFLHTPKQHRTNSAPPAAAHKATYVLWTWSCERLVWSLRTCTNALIKWKKNQNHCIKFKGHIDTGKLTSLILWQ